ncbi:HEPN domain-containing protein [Streptomyces sp. enrichment culture]|uniref:ApeA N-terminal domain 1-containing protein n=1 Tax=Streptomyces sp. enrichment culture TaxID=1795815 RepID=UPI003F553A74
MDTKTAIEVKPQPDNYRCTWHLPHDGKIVDLPGELDLKVHRYPEGAIFAEIPGTWTIHETMKVMGFPQEREFPILKCSLENGLHATLLDCSILIWAENRAAIYARYALVGNRADSDASQIDRLKIQVSGIDSLFGKAPIKGHSMPISEKTVEVGIWSVEQDPESAQVWEDDGAKMTASFDSSITAADPYYFRMCHSPAVLIDIKEPIDFYMAIREWVEPLTDLAALALGRPQRITYLAAGRRNGEEARVGWTKYQVYGAGIHQDPYNSSLKGVAENRSAIKWNAGSGEISPLKALRRWQELNSSHHPLVETYGSFLNVRAQHPRASYLLLLQALEGLHGYENREIERERGQRHRDRKSNVLQTLKSCLSLSPGDLKFLKGAISNNPPKGLDSRLRESFSQIPVDIIQELNKTDLIKAAMTDSRNPHDAADALRIIRNDLAHGNKGYPVEDLATVARILEQVTRAHFLRILGYPESVQVRAVISEAH